MSFKEQKGRNNKFFKTEGYQIFSEFNILLILLQNVIYKVSHVFEVFYFHMWILISSVITKKKRAVIIRYFCTNF